jgi:predicted TPR repeat methyltransferase
MYSMYSKYYDRLNTNYDLWIPFISGRISSFPSGSALIEYGCGTGNVLAHFKDRHRVSGVDLSSGMLRQAIEKIPDGTFYRENMVSFVTGARFDIALCLFDTVNHILRFSDWTNFFRTVAENLKDGGLFILDANTRERLNGMAQRPAFFHEFDDNYCYMKVRKKGGKNFVFDVRILKKIQGNTFEEEREEIEETTESGGNIFLALEEVFSQVDAFNEKKEKMLPDQFTGNEKDRWFYACRK